MKGLALYKEAGSDMVLKIAGECKPYVEGMRGFVISDFMNRSLIITNEQHEGYPVFRGTENFPESTTKEKYIERFNFFHEKLTGGTLKKIVLSRKQWREGEVDIIASFRKACRLYKELTVVLFSTPLSGTWLLATPELLMQMKDGEGYTMALAGTMREGEGEWSVKNREEQRMVADFIGDTLRNCCEMVGEEKPRSVKAGELMHLQSDFSFSTKQPWNLITYHLHPTPAVCGLPVSEAFSLILNHEGYNRKYYSGYCGFVEENNCFLHVILRCAQIKRNGYWLYAGGGLLAESNAESEWKETENKMKTIEECIVIKQK